MYSKEKKILKDAGFSVEKGLSEEEIERIESIYEFRFPPDLKSLLKEFLPAGGSFINWRDTSEFQVNQIKKRFNWPLEGIFFDIEENSFWLEEWGDKPSSVIEAKAIAEKYLDLAPKLIPIYSHRFIPDSPRESSNPIFSVYQTDIIYYGSNLGNYLQVEFGTLEYIDIGFSKIKDIPFWSALCG